MFEQELLDKATHLLEACRQKHLKIATVESCTGGLVAGLLTEIAGSSDVVERGFVTYSNEAKSEAVHVPPALIQEHGAVSKEVACAMAEGGLKHSNAQLCIALTGVAGPGGGTAAKPVGLVHLALAQKNKPVQHLECCFTQQTRSGIRLAAVAQAIDMLQQAAS